MDMELSAKVVVIGSVGVGKSSITIRCVHNQFHQSLDSTLGAVYYEKTNTYKGRKIKFSFWDTAGQEKYKAIAKIYYKDCKIALIVYDVSSRNSFQELKSWVQQLKMNSPQNVIMAIIGNKIDLQNSDSVPFQQASTYAEQIGATLHYTSAKDGKGINQLFNNLSVRLIQSNSQNTNKNEKLSKKKSKKTNCC